MSQQKDDNGAIGINGDTRLVMERALCLLRERVRDERDMLAICVCQELIDYIAGNSTAERERLECLQAMAMQRLVGGGVEAG